MNFVQVTNVYHGELQVRLHLANADSPAFVTSDEVGFDE